MENLSLEVEDDCSYFFLLNLPFTIFQLLFIKFIQSSPAQERRQKRQTAAVDEQAPESIQGGSGVSMNKEVNQSDSFMAVTF